MTDVALLAWLGPAKGFWGGPMQDDDFFQKRTDLMHMELAAKRRWKVRMEWATVSGRFHMEIAEW